MEISRSLLFLVESYFCCMDSVFRLEEVNGEKERGSRWKPVARLTKYWRPAYWRRGGREVGSHRCSPVVASLLETSAATLTPSAKGVGGRVWRLKVWGKGHRGCSLGSKSWRADPSPPWPHSPSSMTTFCNSQKVVPGPPVPHGNYEQANF